MKGKSESEVTQSCPTLRDPVDCSLPGSFIDGNLQARVLEWDAEELRLIVVLKKTLENPLDCKEIEPVNPKGN